MDEDKKSYLYDSKPDVKWLAGEFEETYADLSEYRQKMAKNANIRFCKWANQSEDDRKYGDSAYPFEGASDIRYHLADGLINANVASLTEAFMRANLVANPVEGSDVAKAKLTSNFMKWLTRSQMTELPKEIELAANYWEEKGGFVVGIFWDRRVLTWQERITDMEVAEMFMQMGIDPESINDPMFEEQVREFLQAFSPTASESQINKALKALRESGEAILPKVGQTVNRPCLRVFRKGEDILYPDVTADIQHAPYVFRVEHKTPQQLMEYIITDDWNKGWVEEVIDKCAGLDNTEYDVHERNRDRFGISFHRENEDNLVKVVYAYQRLIDKNGVPGIYETIFCPEYLPEEKTKHAKHGLMEYKLRGDYCFWDFTRESISRNSHNSRGLPDVINTPQRLLKIYHDGKIDRHSLSNDPPRWYMVGRNLPEHGPGASYPIMRPGEFGYAELPPFDPSTIEEQNFLHNYAREYAGLTGEEDRASEVRQTKIKNINNWLRGWQQVYRRVWWLYQQYGDPQVTFRVMGSSTTQPSVFTKNPGEDYDFYLEFDVLSQEPELQQQKIKSLIELFSAADRNGRGDWDGLLQKGVEIIDPTWAEQLIKPQDQAVQDQMEEAMKHFERLWAGMDVTLPEQGINTQIWRQLAQQWLQGSEEVPATDVQQRLQSDEAFKARVEKLFKQLDFIDEQRQNAQIGRIGVTPGNMPNTA